MSDPVEKPTTVAILHKHDIKNEQAVFRENTFSTLSWMKSTTALCTLAVCIKAGCCSSLFAEEELLGGKAPRHLVIVLCNRSSTTPVSRSVTQWKKTQTEFAWTIIHQKHQIPNITQMARLS